MQKLALSVLMTLMLPAFASASVVRIVSESPFESTYVKIIENEDLIGFRACDSSTRKCVRLGKKDFYQRSDLKRKISVERLRGTAVGALDVAIGGVALISGGWIGFGAGASAGGAASTAASTGAMAGAAGGVGLTALVAAVTKKLNPFQHFQGASALSQGLDSDSRANDDIDGFAEKLHRVLSDL